ncbi:hypothetical protein BET01_10380 [Lacrimispora algidixylanolytica]|uniref:Uncharacterized protein n=1 Tax=Lacrimispora algidixylanolytica TaxID=94868 RepID=A0A419STU1_9FIRM|nr:hypothetical protein BET01_10380 [Lacrimispora algidixylanolytica]
MAAYFLLIVQIIGIFIVLYSQALADYLLKSQFSRFTTTKTTSLILIVSSFMIFQLFFSS